MRENGKDIVHHIKATKPIHTPLCCLDVVMGSCCSTERGCSSFVVTTTLAEVAMQGKELSTSNLFHLSSLRIRTLYGGGKRTGRTWPEKRRTVSDVAA